MAAGYAFGAIYGWDAARRRRCLLILGSTTTLLFIVLRAINLYGDPSRWVRQNTIVFTILSFLNTSKYPPSLLFLLMTLGPAMLALRWFEWSLEARNAKPSFTVGLLPRRKIRNFFLTFGRVPLFFYLLQWPTARFIAVALHFFAGKPWRWMFGSVPGVDAPPSGVGFNLAMVYASWLVGVLLLYPLCRWFAGVKTRRREWWLSYL